MIPAVSLGSKDRLRRTKSTRSIKRNHQLPLSSEPFDPDVAKYHASAAASQAMRRSIERSSIESKRSYDRLGGPGNLSVPQRHRRSMDDGNSSSPRPSAISYEENDLSVSVALPPISEFGGLDGRDSSLPSSYRRLRKAKSMFSTRQRTQIGHGISSDSYDAAENYRSSMETPRRYGTLRRSMSFLRGGSQSSWSARHAKTQEASIHLARTQFLQNPESPGNRDTPSPLYSAKTRREQKPFRKTFRTSSESAYNETGSPSWEDQPKGGGRQGKSRSISQTIKKGLRRVLGLSKSTEEPTKSHETSQAESSADLEYNEPYYENPMDPAAFSGLSRTMTVRSVRSSESLATSRSRVTSWADSTVDGTITTRRAGERNPLSVIDELRPTSERFSRSSPTREPIRPDGSVDSQRLYSALVKRIGRENMRSPEEEVSIGHVKEHRLVPERASSVFSRRSRRTIRPVPSDDSMFSPRSYVTARGETVSPQKQHQRLPKRVTGSIYYQDQERGKPMGPDLRRRGGSSSYDKGWDDDTGSVVISKHLDRCSPPSPSVYSRTTSGNSPTKKGQTGAQDGVESEEEPGTVTIYASQRTAYSSPKRMTGDSSNTVPSRPSAEWQQWMNAQIARIETTTPVRDHYREDAQIYSGDNGLLHVATAEARQISTKPLHLPSTDSKGIFEDGKDSSGTVPVQSNFSRPFSRSSSVRTIQPSQKDRRVVTTSPSALSTPVVASTFESQNPSTPDTVDSVPLSPMRSRSGNMARIPESPTPKRDAAEAQQRRLVDGQYRQYSAMQSPFREARTAQYRSMRSRQDRRLTNENARVDDGRGNIMDQYDKLQDIHSTISSKRMVDMFLDSRRRQMGMDDGTTPEGAFI